MTLTLTTRRLAPATLTIALVAAGAALPVEAATPSATTVVGWGEGALLGSSSPAYGVRDIATSGWSTLVLGSDGRVIPDYSRGSSGEVLVPDHLRDATDIAVSGIHAIALHADGTVTAWSLAPWNWEPPSPPTDLDQVTAVGVGETHGLALRSDGTLVTWGDYAPMTELPGGLDDVVAIDTAHATNLALRADGTVVAWGVNYAGQLDVPAGLDDVVAISAGEYHSLALRRDGTVVAWGNNNWGQGVVPSGLTNVVAIDAGAHHNLALRADGTVVTWGMEGLEDLEGYGGALDTPSGLTGVTEVVAGVGASYAFIEDPDTTAPTLDPLSDVTAEATGPGGALVSYPVPSASDETDGVVPVTCAPAPATTFAIGTSRVICSAVDAAGNSTTGSFTVTVLGAPAQLAELRRTVTGVGPGASLAGTVAVAQAALVRGHAALAVAALSAFSLQVRAHAGRRIPADLAATLIGHAHRIRSVLGG